MTPKELQQLGTLISDARKKQALSQKRLGELVGVPNSTILRLERGEHLPRLDLLTAIAAALEVPLTDMFKKVGYKAPIELPPVGPYLRRKYPEFSAEQIEEIERHVARVAKRIGVDLTEEASSNKRPPKRTARTPGKTTKQVAKEKGHDARRRRTV